jgi:hypothetical protein
VSRARIALIAVGLAFATWEATDIFWIDVPAIAAAFAAMFFAATAWFWRRDSTKAAGTLVVLCGFEAAVAPSLKHVMMVTKVSAFSLGIAGVVAGLAVVVARLRRGHAVEA